MRLSAGRGLLIRLLVSLVLVGILVKRYGPDENFRASLARLEARTFLLAEAVLAGGLLLSALRWKILLAAAGVRVGLGRSVRLYFAAYFFNFFLPTTVGGDVVRALGVGKGTPLSVVGGSIVVERLLGFGCLLVLGIGASLTSPGLAVARGALLLAGGAFAVALAVLLGLPLRESTRAGLLGRILRGIRRTALEIRAYGFRPRALGWAAALSLGWQGSLVAANSLLATGLGGLAPVGSLLALIPVIQAVSMIPVSFGGLGVREMGYAYFFRACGLEAAGAVALGASFLGVAVALALKGGLLYLVWPVRGREA